MILLWGLLQDATTRSVYDHLRRRHADLAFVDYADLARTRLRLATHPDVSYHLTCGDLSYRLEEMSAAYLRPHDPRDYAEGANLSRVRVVHSLINDWAESSPATIINRPSAEGTNHSKLWQALQIQAAGFLVPQSIVTNDPEQVREFHARHGSLIFKSMSSVRSIVKALDPSSLDSIDALGPVLFQQRIAGQNVRVHVVRDETMASAVETEGVDYRYASSSLMQIPLPPDIAKRCVALTQRLGLVLAGIDLMVTPEDEWYCLEVNTNPGFSYYDLWDNEKIARTVASLLE